VIGNNVLKGTSFGASLNRVLARLIVPNVFSAFAPVDADRFAGLRVHEAVGHAPGKGATGRAKVGQRT
jgi:hypothetical protein